MTERPDFAGVIHAEIESEYGKCDHTPHYQTGEPFAICSHLSAALNAELDRWLGDDEARERVGMDVLDSVLSTPGDQPGYADTITAAALAALTTTDPKEHR